MLDPLLDLLIYLLLSLPLVGAYAMLGVGIVVIFRASRVLNLAHGAMAMLPAYVMYELVNERNVPVLLAVPVAVASGGALGMLTERVFVRTLRRQGPTAQTVGTVAMFGLVVSLVAKVYGTAPLIGPRVFPDGGPEIKGSTIFWGDLGLFLTAVVAAGGLLAVFKFTDLGLSLRGAADNRVAAALVGIDPDRNARVAWLIGGCLAGVAGVLLGGVNNLSPYTLSLQMLPAFVAALIGGLSSLTGVLVGAACVGVLQGMVPAIGLIDVGPVRRISGQLGLSQLVLTVIALSVMYLRGGKYSSSDIRAEQATGTAEITAGRRRFSPTLPVARRRLAGVPIRVWRYALLVVLLVWPFWNFGDAHFSLQNDAIQAGLYVIAASSIVLLTGWVGQISLGQAAFVGIGAFSTAIVIRRLSVPFPANLFVAAAIAAAAAVVLGVVALRVRGLYLAVATLIFAYMADAYLFVSPWFAGSGGSSSAKVEPIGQPGTQPFFDLSDRRTFYFVVLAVAASVIFGLLNLRDSKTGRAFFAIRGSETAAASLGIDVRRYKLIAFALAGAIAGVAGNLTFVGQGTVVSAQFSISASLLVLAIAVVGGLQSLGGCVAASIVFSGLNELFFRVPALTGYLEVASAVLLAAVLLVYPGGLAAVPSSLARLFAPVTAQVRDWSARHRVAERLDGLRSTGALGRVRDAMPWNEAGATTGIRAAEPKSIPLPAVAPVAQEPEPGEDLPVKVHLPDASVSSVIDVRGVRVEFDGLVAVDNADLQVGPGEIVGLIGPNGAGKTTLFNAISGLVVPTSGTVSLFGEDVTDLPVHERARRGLGRTFQAIQLFPQLSVYENLLVATHASNPTGLYAHVFLTRRGVRHEAAAEESVRRAIRFMRLEQFADRTVAGLPFGVLRRVEIARTLVGGWPVIMLDEPASGLDNAETDQLSELLLDLRARLGVSLLLIEHDVRMVTGVSDRMYVLVHGKIVSSGTPDVVREDPTVIAAYLGDAAAPTTETVPA